MPQSRDRRRGKSVTRFNRHKSRQARLVHAKLLSKRVSGVTGALYHTRLDSGTIFYRRARLSTGESWEAATTYATVTHVNVTKRQTYHFSDRYCSRQTVPTVCLFCYFFFFFFLTCMSLPAIFIIATSFWFFEPSVSLDYYISYKNNGVLCSKCNLNRNENQRIGLNSSNTSKQFIIVINIILNCESWRIFFILLLYTRRIYTPEIKKNYF